jgi:hypothetical protein
MSSEVGKLISGQTKISIRNKVMADIKVKDLATDNISGSDLFQDSENFMVELGDEIEEINGGLRSESNTLDDLEVQRLI